MSGNDHQLPKAGTRNKSFRRLYSIFQYFHYLSNHIVINDLIVYQPDDEEEAPLTINENSSDAHCWPGNNSHQNWSCK